MGLLLFFLQSFTTKIDIMNTELDNLRVRMNRDFRVKINHGSLSTLVGWRGLVEHVGQVRAKWLVREAFSRDIGNYTWKSRNGLKIVFYGK